MRLRAACSPNYSASTDSVYDGVGQADRYRREYPDLSGGALAWRGDLRDPLRKRQCIRADAGVKIGGCEIGQSRRIKLHRVERGLSYPDLLVCNALIRGEIERRPVPHGTFSENVVARRE